MNKRTCPNCNAKLTDFDNLFCTSCGKKLSPDVILVPPALKIKSYKLNYLTLGARIKNTFRSKKNLQMIDSSTKLGRTLSTPQVDTPKNKMAYVLGGVLVAFVLGFSLIYIKTNFLDSYRVRKPENSPKFFANTVDLGLEFESNIFGSDFITEYIPQQTLLYVESHDSHEFVKSFVRPSNFNSQLQLNVSDIVHKHFAVFAYEIDDQITWNFIFLPKNPKLADSLVKENSIPKWYIQTVEGALVVSTTNKVFEVVKGAKLGHIPNVSLNPNYVKGTNNLQRGGQVLTLLLNREKALKALESLDLETLHPDLKETVEYIKKSGFNEFVVDNAKVTK